MTASVAGAAQQIGATVVTKTTVADGVVQLRLRPQDGAHFARWLPGAHIDVMLPGGALRQYSLHSDPTAADEYLISVLYEPDGRGGSRAVHDDVQVGQKLAISEPRNHFELTSARSYLFIAGGIGITPILPMVRSVAVRRLPWRLVYGGRTRTSMAYLDEVLAQPGGRVDIYPQDETGMLDVLGILNDSSAGDAIYCCGPAGLLEAVEQHCKNDQAERLHVERFAASAQFLDQADDQEFELVLNRTGVTLTIPPDRTAMDVISEQTSLSPFSCGVGSCGTCEVAVLEGTPDHRDSILSAKERAANQIMHICVGRSQTPRLVIDL
ncbi:PDR/VanB family oxidoreductase [Mycobacterium aquaticum]|uniref:Oxidoreductase n=1 Tax=Mycobacterium aquaticum TaxID=1927124 RepID=A0A1W9ZUP5_9MYCO|nr:PDR/VanB family oxidoreductase [Mycobacterium aquaticum]ORA21481.1 hypothetical protein BST13_37545 [Mycobacterium aquaticum]